MQEDFPDVHHIAYEHVDFEPQQIQCIKAGQPLLSHIRSKPVGLAQKYSNAPLLVYPFLLAQHAHLGRTGMFF